jgi:hypothetical protein
LGSIPVRQAIVNRVEKGPQHKEPVHEESGKYEQEWERISTPPTPCLLERGIQIGSNFLVVAG